LDVGRSTFAPSSAPAVSAPPSLDDDEDDDLPAPGKVWEGPKESLATLMARQSAPASSLPAEPSNVEPVRAADLSAQWKAMLQLVAEQGPALSGLLQNGQFVGVEDGRAVIRLPKQNETFIKLLEKGNKKDVVRAAFSQVLNEQVGVHFEVAPDGPAQPPARPASTVRPTGPRPPAPVAAPAPPPATVEASTAVRLTDEIRNKLYKTEPLVRAIVDQLGGSVIKLEE
jgi:hypothetical protein